MAFTEWNKKSSTAWNNAWSADNLGSTIGALTTGATGILSAAADNAQVKDTSAIESKIEDIADSQFNYQDYDSLQAAYNPSVFNKTFTREDVRENTDGQKAVNIGKGVLSGAATGATIGGPWGAVAGAAVGLGSGLAGLFIGNKKETELLKKLNNEQRDAEARYLANVNNNITNISRNMFNTAAINVAANGGKLKSKTKMYIGFDDNFAYGGNLNLSGDFSNGVTIVGEGGTHEQNKYEGVPMGMDENGVPNLVEEGEVIFNDYVFSRRLKPTKSQLREVLLNPKYEGKNFAEIATLLQKESSENPFDPISRNTLVDSMGKLMTIQEMTRNKKNINSFAFGGRKYDGTTEINQFLQKFNTENLRYFPIISTGFQALSDKLGWSNKEDYTNPNIVRNASRNVRNISARPISGFIAPTLYDPNYTAQKIDNQGLAAMSAILNASSGNRGNAIASLLALNNNITSQRGDNYRRGLEFNDESKRAAAQFNYGINSANSQLGLQAGSRNQAADIERMDAAVKEAMLRDQIETASSQAKSSNSTIFTNNIGNLGRDEYFKNSAYDWLRAQGLESQYLSYVKNGKRSNGGKIKRGFTF